MHSDFKLMITFEVACYERDLNVLVDEVHYEQAQTILDARYEDWLKDTDDNHGMCCEEWMLRGLDEAGIRYIDVTEKLEEEDE